MPQLEDGYLKIANEIIDVFCRTRISGVEWQLLWVVLRQTYGWNKKKEFISLKWFVKMTGLRKPNVVRELKKLREKNLIIVIKNDNDKGNIYKFNKNLDEWKPLSKKITLSKMITTVIKNDNLPLSKMRPIKDTLIKDTLKKQKRKDISVQPELEQGQERSEKRAVKVKKKKPVKKQYAEFVFMTEIEYEKLQTKYGESVITKCIETLDNYKGSNGKKYKNDYRAILSWVIDKFKPTEPKKISMTVDPDKRFY